MLATNQGEGLRKPEPTEDQTTPPNMGLYVQSMYNMSYARLAVAVCSYTFNHIHQQAYVLIRWCHTSESSDNVQFSCKLSNRYRCL